MPWFHLTGAEVQYNRTGFPLYPAKGTISTMQGIPPIKAVMTPFPYSIESGASISAADEMMRSHAIRHLPVMEAGKLVGMVSDRDIRLIQDPKLPTPPEDRSVGDICSRDIYVVQLMDPLDGVLEHMAARHIGSAVVVKQGRLAGIFTVTDACRLYGELLQSLYPSQEDREPA
jgi:acetoin utilization protein AcuB